MNVPKSLTLSAIVLGLVLPAVRPVYGQHDEPDVRIHSYRFLPRLSVINESGGIAGLNTNYRVRGTFDFKIQPSPLAVFPPVYNAFFIDPEVVGLHPVRDDLLDVDEALNLEGLVGGQRLDHPRRPHVFHFQGKTGDEPHASSVELHALLFGPWLYLRGGTTPPEGSADFFEYDIRAVARRQPSGDFNGDGIVDAADLHDWIHRPGRTGNEFLDWQMSLGEEPPSVDVLDAELNAALAAAATVIPEPGTLGMLAVGTGLALMHRRRRC